MDSDFAKYVLNTTLKKFKSLIDTAFFLTRWNLSPCCSKLSFRRLEAVESFNMVQLVCKFVEIARFAEKWIVLRP